MKDLALSKIEDWMAACHFNTQAAAAHALGVHRHTIEKMRERPLSKLEALAMQAVYHRLQPFDRNPPHGKD